MYYFMVFPAQQRISAAPEHVYLYRPPAKKTFLRCLPPLFPKGAGVMVKYLDAAFITADKKNTDVLALYPEMPV